MDLELDVSELMEQTARVARDLADVVGDTLRDKSVDEVTSGVAMVLAELCLSCNRGMALNALYKALPSGTCTQCGGGDAMCPLVEHRGLEALECYLVIRGRLAEANYECHVVSAMAALGEFLAAAARVVGCDRDRLVRSFGRLLDRLDRIGQREVIMA
jgi:hypothetical protein